MAIRKSLGLPITLAVLMIVMVIILLIVWLLGVIWASRLGPLNASLFWAIVPLAAIFLIFILAGVITYLVISVQLINLNRRQSNFIDAVSHELNSPLASLKLSLQTLERLKLTEHERQNMEQTMKKDVDRLERLVTQVLTVSVLEGRPAKRAEKNPVPVLAIIDAITKDIEIRYGIKPLSIKVYIPDIYVKIYRSAIELILRNLIENAYKYAQSNDPQIIVRARRIAKTNRWVIRITDNGTGIPTSMRKKIFLRFYRVGDELERTTTGTGLGLYIVKLLTRQIRGKIKICDRSSQKGSHFDLVLPGEYFTDIINENNTDQTESTTPDASPVTSLDIN